MTPNVDNLNLIQRVQLAWRLMQDDRVSSWVKKLGPAAIIAYVLSPIDLIPDFLLGAGQVDDLGVVTVGLVILLRMLIRFAPDDVVNEHVGKITGTRWKATASTFDRDETIDTSGRVRQ